MSISEATYARVAMEDPEGQWELVCGRLRSKPSMTMEHNRTSRRLMTRLVRQLDERDYAVSLDQSRVRISSGSFYVPDVCVIPLVLEQRLGEQPGTFEVYDDPLPLVVEVWSPSTGDYDVEQKLKEYQLRLDREIWRLHPYEKTLTVWRRQPDDTYTETLYRGGTIQPVALPGVTIDIDALWG